MVRRARLTARLDVHTDRNGTIDGPLGVASALVAVDRLAADGLRPTRPLGVAVFPEEEGSRFGVACLGSTSSRAAA